MSTTAASKIIVRRFVLLGSAAGGGVSVYGSYKAHYDPIHLVWDLDNTLLCSVTPVPHQTTNNNNNSFLRYDYFDHMDDDFPYANNLPNTRTYWRPGARTALQICSLFAIQHIYTTAQGTYTENILNQMQRHLFHTVIHRDIAPTSVRCGKDLSLILDELHKQETGNKSSSIGLHRILLFDDRLKNFAPQNGRNGVHVPPFEVALNKPENDNDDISSSRSTLVPITIKDWWREGKQVVRMVGIAVLALLVPGDIRDSLLPYVRTSQHNERFPPTDD